MQLPGNSVPTEWIPLVRLIITQEIQSEMLLKSQTDPLHI